MPDATFVRPDLTTFCRLDELGLEVTGQRLEPGRAVLACRVVDDDGWCRRCGCEGAARDSVVRRLAHEPLGWRPTTLEVTVRRYRCTGCGHVWRQDTTRAAPPRAKLYAEDCGGRWMASCVSTSRSLDKVHQGKAGPPVALGVITTTGYAYRRPDGILVLPSAPSDLDAPVPAAAATAAAVT